MAKPTGAAVGGPAAAAAAVTAAAAANGGEHSVIVEAVSVAPAAAPAPAIADQQPVDQAAGMHESARLLAMRWIGLATCALSSLARLERSAT